MIILFNDSPNFPNRSVGVYRIATALRNYGLEVEVIDYLSHWDLQTLKKYLDSIQNIEWFGFSTKFFSPFVKKASYVTMKFETESGLFSNYTPAEENELIEYCKQRNKKIVLGGPNADKIKSLNNPFDIIIAGYADNSVISVHNHIVNDQPLTFEYFSSAMFVNSDRDYPVTDLSELGTTYHESDFLQIGETFPIEIGRGCMFHCAFCEFTHLGKKPGTYIRDKESIKKDIVDRYEKYGSTTFLFVDDTFNDSIEKMQMIKEIRNETGIDFKFWAYCRLDLLASQPEMVELIPEIGWASMTFGVETFNRDSGKAVGKGADPNKLKDFLLKLRERFTDLKFQINLIIGLPHDTVETATDTVQWFIDNIHITPNLKVGNLGIRNPEGRIFSSKFATNPEKYGYTIISKNRHNLHWKTDHMDHFSASKLARELQKQFNAAAKKVHANIQPIAELRDEVTLDTTTGEWKNNLSKLVKIYINNKLEYRNIGHIDI